MGNAAGAFFFFFEWPESNTPPPLSFELWPLVQLPSETGNHAAAKLYL